MKNNHITLILLALLVTTYGCRQRTGAGNDGSAVQSFEDTLEQALPVADESLSSYALLYAGVDVPASIQLTDYQKSCWDLYSAEVKAKLAGSYEKMKALDSLSRQDFSDINNRTKLVFYPFGGPDLFYPLSIFPEADTYCLTGLEPAGTVIDTIVGTGTDYSAFLEAHRNFFTYGYFRTSQMMQDLRGVSIDGTAPLFSMQLGAMGYSIESAGYKVLSEGGALADTLSPTDIVEFKVFKPGDRKTRTIIYFKTNLENTGIPDDFLAFISHQEQASTSVFLKAASYLLHYEYFSTIRDHILSHSSAIVQDDTGVPYKKLCECGWDITLYGQYMHPLRDFEEYCNQPDLELAFNERGSRPMPVRIGYNRVSNLLVCRKVQ